MTPDLYFVLPPKHPADPPRLHQSIATLLANHSPLHAWHKAFAAEPEEWDDVTNRGQIAHSLLLGGKDIVCVAADDWRTKAAKEAREAARADGKLPILEPKLEAAQTLTAIVRGRLAERGIALTGQNEVTAIWQTLGGVWCEGKIDHFIHPGLILDFKFTKGSVAKKACENRFLDYGYDIQHAAYVDAIECIFPEFAGRVKMKFVFVEVEPPHAVRIMPVGGSMSTSGKWRWGRAVEVWKECLEKYGIEKPWPSYSDDGEPAELPTWAMNEAMANAILEESNAE